MQDCYLFTCTYTNNHTLVILRGAVLTSSLLFTLVHTTKYEGWFCSKLLCCCIICFSVQLFTHSVRSLSVLTIICHVDFYSKCVPNVHRWHSENVEFVFVLFVSAAESSWGKSVSETSAPAGHCTCGSVPHAPHGWVSCKDLVYFLIKNMYFTHSVCILDSQEAFIFSCPLTDYLNNLSPDSKEYKDTQGSVNKRQSRCGQRQLLTGEPYWPVFVTLCEQGIYLLSFGTKRRSWERQFRFFCLRWKPTRQSFQLSSVWKL